MANIPQNQTYTKLSEAAFGLGKQLPFQRVRQAIRTNQPIASSTSTIPTDITKLGKVTVPYGGSTRFEKFHKGIDIAAPIGTPIPAPTSGTVVATRTGQVQTPTKPGYGNYVILKDELGNFQRFSHLNNTMVSVGSQVKRGQPIGTVGATGGAYSLRPNGSGAHLDYRIYDAYKNYYDPASYLSKYK